MRRAVSVISWIAWLAVSVLCAASHFVYSTAGLDFEWPHPDGKLTRFARIRWDAGCTFAGVADVVRPRGEGELDWFDPGGTLFKPSVPMRAHGWWRRRGFWWIDSPADDPYLPNARMTHWGGVPSWLVLMASGAGAGSGWWGLSSVAVGERASNESSSQFSVASRQTENSQPTTDNYLIVSPPERVNIAQSFFGSRVFSTNRTEPSAIPAWKPSV